MNIEESKNQIETLIEAWQLKEADLNQTDINAMQVLLKENQELKKQLEEYQKELEKADSITQSCIFNGKEESKISYRKCLNILEKKENQQKEFIKYMNDIIKDLETEDVDDEEMKGYLIQRVDTFKEILQKYKEIIGVEDESR